LDIHGAALFEAAQGIGHFPKKAYSKVMALKARVSYRQKLHPVRRAIDVGFRCAQDKPSLYERWFGKDEEKIAKAGQTLK